MDQKEKVARFRKKFIAENPIWYSGVLHYLFNGILLIGSTTFFFYQITDLKPIELLAIPVLLIAGNLSVYLIHRYPLHRKYRGIKDETYGQHTLIHHRFYTNEHYQVAEGEDSHSFLFPPVVVLLFCAIFLPILYFIFSLFLPHNFLFLSLGMSSSYFILYEIVHYASHLPEGHIVLKIGHFRRMRQHHLDHHNPRMMDKYNFNIVFPLFDHVFGTKFK